MGSRGGNLGLLVPLHPINVRIMAANLRKAIIEAEVPLGKNIKLVTGIMQSRSVIKERLEMGRQQYYRELPNHIYSYMNHIQARRECSGSCIFASAIERSRHVTSAL